MSNVSQRAEINKPYGDTHEYIFPAHHPIFTIARTECICNRYAGHLKIGYNVN